MSFSMIEMISEPGAYETCGPADHPGRQQQVRVAAPGPGRGAASHTTARTGSSSVLGYFCLKRDRHNDDTFEYGDGSFQFKRDSFVHRNLAIA